MKLVWNSLLISLGILLPTSTLLAQTTRTSDPASLAVSTSEGVAELINTVPPTQGTVATPNAPTFVVPVSAEVPTPGSKPSVERPETIVIPEITPVSRPDTPKTEEAKPTPNPEATETQPNTTDKQEASPDAETAEEGKTDAEEEQEAAPTPEEIARQQKLMEADQLFLGGQFPAAEQLYRQAKEPFSQTTVTNTERKQPITDLEQLPPAGQVYWRISTAGLEQKLDTKIFVPLERLVAQYPEFIPGQLRYAQALKDYNRAEEAIQVLERATTLYPNQPDLLKTKIALLTESKKWLEASLAARQFSLLNPNHPEAETFAKAADENLKRYQSHLRAELRGNAIANVITGALGYALTGNLFGPLTAVETTALLLRGESAVGERITKQAQRQLDLVEDEEVVNYVRDVGNRLAIVAGRNDFKYEFYVVQDDRLNAFALPGGKIFVNAGAILRTNSEAELAGLLAHEISHAVLSHGFQLATEGNLTANLTQFIPYGGTLANLIVLNYSRDMERQADVLGTRILTSSSYAADGLRNLMVTLDKQDRDRPLFSWLSSHPVTDERISNLETLINRNGYNRYAYEGVARHTKMKERVKKLLAEYKERQKRR